jgi:hypothetical protein
MPRPTIGHGMCHITPTTTTQTSPGNLDAVGKIPKFFTDFDSGGVMWSTSLPNEHIKLYGISSTHKPSSTYVDIQSQLYTA